MQIPEYFEFFNKTKLCSGKMALENISFDLKSMDSVKPLVVTDNRSVKSGYVKILKKSFYDSGMVIGAIYDRVNDYPSTATVREIAELYRIRGCDSIISLGGNSPAAVAKGLNILVSNRSDNLMDFTDMSRSASLRPFLSVLTSAAAGTETSSEAVIDARSYRSFDLMPDIVYIDARLAKKGNTNQIVNAGLMSLAQSIEACNFKESNPVNDSFAYASISALYSNIAAVVKKSGASKDMPAFINGLAISGIVRSNAAAGLAGAIGLETEKLTGFSAGIVAGIVLPRLLEYKLQKVKTGVRPELLLPIAGIDTYCSTDENRRASLSVELIYELLGKLKDNVPDNIKMMPIPEYMIERIASGAEARGGKNYPKGTTLKVLEMAYHGKKSSEVK
ncbi:MAG: iron-containing alcohol dehydrogenase [Spirochaetes bacterium]|nr:iron-containing alcohol dehydrogenase [Spirochaetota bacterium]